VLALQQKERRVRVFSLIIPYYNQPTMLAAQMEIAKQYPDSVRVIVIDDGSPVPAKIPTKQNISLYRINIDIPWNREQARNLGAYVADTQWIIQVDIDHVLPVACATRLLELTLNPKDWHRFPRYRIGKADETRKKDTLSPDVEYGKIHPHVDSFLITRDMFLSSPYDERYSGCLGGGTPFAARMKRLYGEPRMLPEDVFLQVYTKSKVKDASISTLSRDTSEYARRREQIGANDKPTKMLLHPWHKVI
jgi:glycosyltransferase involved in cell wall biosynthesis